MKGIDNTSRLQQTLCYCYLSINLGETIITHCFHVVPDDFTIPFDGLLGNDFVKTNSCQINYNSNKLIVGTQTIQLHNIEQSIQKPDKESSIPKSKTEIILEPRCETVVQLKVINSDLKEGICERIQLLEDVFICPSLVRVTNNQIIT